MKSLKVPYGRAGGKHFLSKTIVKMIPTDYKIYCEPFFGAGAVFFRKGRREGEVEVINDADEDVYFIMQLLKENSNWVNEHFNRTPDKKYFESIRDSRQPLHVLERLKTSFYNKGVSFNEALFSNKTIQTDYSPYSERLKDTIILNNDYTYIINAYDSPTTFFYLDPPYEVCNKGFYKGHNNIDYTALRDKLKTIKGRFLMSINDSPNIRDIFKDFNIQEVSTRYSVCKKTNIRKVGELVITNYPSTPPI